MCLYTFLNVKMQKYIKINKIYIGTILSNIYLFIYFLHYKKYKYIIYGRVF